MEHAVNWIYCRYEGCQRKLHPLLKDQGFCGSECEALYKEEKEFNTLSALEAFKREGEPNGGKR